MLDKKEVEADNGNAEPATETVATEQAMDQEVRFDSIVGWELWQRRWCGKKKTQIFFILNCLQINIAQLSYFSCELQYLYCSFGYVVCDKNLALG